MPLGLLGKNLGSDRVYNASGNLIAVTVVLAGPNRVIQVKTQAGKDGYNAVQLGFGEQKPQRIAKPALGHLVKHGALDKVAAEKARDKGDKTALVGVMKINRFFLSVTLVSLRKRFPRNGISPKIGTLVEVSPGLSSTKPPMTSVLAFGMSTWVSMVRVSN